ncbi:hypothetical protein Tco_1182687 [Tanacetum coccineum]
MLAQSTSLICWLASLPTSANKLQHAPQAPPTTAGPAKTMSQRLARMEDEVHEIRGSLGEQREVMDTMAKDLSRFTVWAVGGISQLLDFAEQPRTVYLNPCTHNRDVD